MRAMILGAGGMLGHDLVATAPEDIGLFPFTHAQLDITDTRSLASVVADVQPDVLINAAAYTAVDRAESEWAQAFRVNAEAVGELGRIAARAAARVIHFSTDYVFDGTAVQPYGEDTPTKPINAYGASKLAGESMLRESGADFVILRTQWLFGVHGRSFPRTMWERATTGLPVTVVRDQTGRPTSTNDLSHATWRVIDTRISGLMHAANDGTATWFDIAEFVFSRAGKVDLLTQCAAAEHHTPAARPRYSVLDTRRLARCLGGSLPHWRRALARFLDELTVRSTVT